MLHTYPLHQDSESALHPEAVWVDLTEPTDEEARLVSAATGLHVPTLAELSEIESSSRLQRRNGVLTLSMPSLTPAPLAEGGRVAAVGYVLSRDRLVTVRFAKIPTFDTFAEACRAGHEKTSDSVDVFLGLLEGVVDRLADLLERQGDGLDHASRQIFHPGHKTRNRPERMNRKLRGVLREVGTVGDLVSKIRDTLLGIGRILPFVQANAAEWIGSEERLRFETLQSDVRSLNDYDAHLSNKVQFLLDATLGFINIEQNNTFKILTVVSIVGIPPTFVASLYGMNFQDIPELHWSFGYYYALGLMLITAVIPLVWFRLRGWL